MVILGRQAQKEATHARILDVARLHFERDGFEAANLRAIAAEAGVAPGTIMLHFTDKLGLLHTALHDDLEDTIRGCLEVQPRGALLTRLCAVARPFYAYYAARPALSKILLRESLLAESPWRERFTEQLVRVNAHVIGILEEAKARGELAGSMSSPLIAAAFSSFYYFALIGWVQGALQDPMPLFKKLMAQHIERKDDEIRHDDEHHVSQRRVP
jgi:AcrR family transcriptional regulator